MIGFRVLNYSLTSLILVSVIYFYNSRVNTIPFPSYTEGDIKISDLRYITSKPRRLIIPKIGIDTTILPVGTNQDGNMDVPKNLLNVGWYKDGVMPGNQGNSVIAGHEVDQFGLGVVFNHLHELSPGDKIFVISEKNEKIPFTVVKKEIYDYNKAPLDEIFGKSNDRNLNLITCNGDYKYSLGTKDKRLVVYATYSENI